MFAAVAAVVGLLTLRTALGGSERNSTLQRLFVVCTSTPNQVNLSSYRAALMGLSYFQLTLH